MTWLLAHLLVGFVLRFIAADIMHITTDLDWRWELAATVLWPLTIVCALIMRARANRDSPPPAS